MARPVKNHELTRELDFVAFRDVWHSRGRIAPSALDLRCYRSCPIVLLEHDWKREIGRVVKLRVERLDGVESLTGTMRVLGPGRNAALDALAAPPLVGTAGPSIAVQWKPGQRAVVGGWLEEISLTADPAMPGAVITALNPLEWRI
jgi:hypothetical protein